MSLFVEAVEVDEVVDVGLDVVVGLVGTLPMMRIRFLALELLTIQVLLKKEMLGSLLKDVGTVDHEVLIVVGAVEVLAMVKVVKVKKDALEEHLIVAVGRAEEMNLNVKVLDVVIGERKVMILPRKLRKL